MHCLNQPFTNSSEWTVFQADSRRIIDWQLALKNYSELSELYNCPTSATLFKN